MGREPAKLPEFINVGRIVAAWGLKGEVKVQVATDFPERFAPGNVLYLNRCPLEIERSRTYKGLLLVKFAAVDSIEDASKLIKQDLAVPVSMLRRLPEGEYYTFQLIGLDVQNTGGRHLGRIEDIVTTESNDVYVVKSERGEMLIPAIEDVVKRIDLERGVVIIEEIEGL